MKKMIVLLKISTFLMVFVFVTVGIISVLGEIAHYVHTYGSYGMPLSSTTLPPDGTLNIPIKNGYIRVKIEVSKGSGFEESSGTLAGGYVEILNYEIRTVHGWDGNFYYGIEDPWGSNNYAHVVVEGYTTRITVYDSNDTVVYQSRYHVAFELWIDYPHGKFAKPSDAGLPSWFDDINVVVHYLYNGKGDHRLKVDGAIIEYEPGDKLRVEDVQYYGVLVSELRFDTNKKGDPTGYWLRLDSGASKVYRNCIEVKEFPVSWLAFLPALAAAIYASKKLNMVQGPQE